MDTKPCGFACPNMLISTQSHHRIGLIKASSNALLLINNSINLDPLKVLYWLYVIVYNLITGICHRTSGHR